MPIQTMGVSKRRVKRSKAKKNGFVPGTKSHRTGKENI